MNGRAELLEFLSDCIFQHLGGLKKSHSDPLPSPHHRHPQPDGLFLCFSENVKISTIVRTLCMVLRAS